MNQRHWKSLLLEPGRQWVLLSGGCYVLACVLPAYELQIMGKKDVILGLQCLMMFPLFWWWANPLYLVAAIAYCVDYRRTSAVFGVLAMLLALHFEFFVLGEGQSVRTGCMFWTVSFQIVFLNAVWHLWLDRKRQLESLSSSDPV
ncbi:hypothetical protein [Schlesneria paludicola]|uniref:hypothetical protein n=1 Tax=Schlesneria paludicola TaxID=360056 RepID=UPI00029B2846|nr:hypothetical protein [Schlesneria paludicola]